MQKDGSLIVMESRYSFASAFVNLVIQEKQCDGKLGRRVRGKDGKLKIKTDKVKPKTKVGFDSSAVTAEGASQWRSLSTGLFTCGGGHG